ncbi:hypothetical protein FQN49_004944 [Arthroderma sp. PD_2]|nr:hypothetical protein FQN49_004944 [Arthroderma sp. PD_2]
MGLNRSSRPHRSGPIDHDVFEGLPVRRWSRQPTTFSQVPKPTEEETSIVDSQSLPELPMPRDSNLLTPVSRALLRAARAGCTYIRPVRKDPEPEEIEPKDDEDTAVEQTVHERTFVATKWTLAPRNVEPPEVEFLAPRRTGLPSLYGAGAQANAAAATSSSTPMRKTKFKKSDPTTGIISIYEAWVPEGYQVEGEIIQEAQVIAANPDVKVVNVEPAPGTLVADVGVVNKDGAVVATTNGSAVVPNQNKSKRKLKSGGKSKSRKKVMFAPGNGTGQPVAPGAEASGDAAAQSAVSENGVTPSGTEQAQEDEDEEEDDEEGDESEEEDETTADSKPTPTTDGPGDENTTPAVDTPLDEPNIPPQTSTVEQISIEQTSTVPPRDLSSSPEVPLATTSASEQPSKSPTEEPKEATGPTEVPDEAVLPPEPQQADLADLPQANPPNASPANAAADDTKPGSSTPPVPESINAKIDTADEVDQPTPEKPVSPQAPAKEEEVSQADAEAETKPQTPPVSAPTSEPIPEQNPDPSPAPDPVPVLPTSSDEPVEPPAATASQSPLPGTSAEEQPTTTEKQSPLANPVHFDDGEVDLLGSLEASLDKKADSLPDSTAQHQSEEVPTSTTEQKEDDDKPHSEIPATKEEESNDDGKDIEMTG